MGQVSTRLCVSVKGGTSGRWSQSAFVPVLVVRALGGIGKASVSQRDLGVRRRPRWVLRHCGCQQLVKTFWKRTVVHLPTYLVDLPHCGGLYSPPTFHMDSTWTPHGMDLIPHESTWIPPFHMEYILAEIPPILRSPFHMDSMWIPCGMVMECPNST